MALAHRTNGRGSGHTASTSTATAANMTATSPPTPAGPLEPFLAGTWGTTNSTSCFSNLEAVLIIVICFSCIAMGLLYAARFLLYCRDLHRHRDRAVREPKPPSDTDDDDDDGSADASLVVAGVWAEAECAICLAEFIDDDGGGLEEGGGEERLRVRVLPACGHGFHAACVEAWLATRASCPTCRTPLSSRSRCRSRPSTPRPTLRQP